ncbi:MAG: AAA family ATPase [Bacteroidetes bacterium]|nr:MAG: AAA family ATPase [Bacteroidota bacterium]
MERLKQLSIKAVNRTNFNFKRYLYSTINWDRRMIGITGARGTGKTIMMLQYLKQIQATENAMYISLDDVYFAENKLVYFAEDFVKYGGTYLLIDEVHKYRNWSQELKNIYDNLPELKIIFTSSSALEIHKGSHDLSRRAVLHNLAGLSFREFLKLKYNIDLPTYTLEQILSNSDKIVTEILKRSRPLALFNEYLKEGYYPFFLDANSDYLKQLISSINLVLESDLPAIHNIDFSSIIKLKSLLSIISRIVPFKPNIEKLARQTNTSRETLLKYLYYLDKAQTIKWLGSNTNGINYLNKPDKIYLANTNIAYALSENNTNIGNLRETFFLNQLSQNNIVTYPKKGDFMVNDKYLFEIGGKDKTNKQIAGIKDAYIAADDIEYGFANKIPLWLFGFLY